MSMETVRDYAGRTIGYLEVHPSGDIDVRDTGGRLVGTYEAESGLTKDTKGRIVLRGNKASTLLGLFEG